MRGKVFRQKQRKSFKPHPVEMKGKITRSFAQQVDAFIRDKPIPIFAFFCLTFLIF